VNVHHKQLKLKMTYAALRGNAILFLGAKNATPFFPEAIMPFSSTQNHKAVTSMKGACNQS
jgi:hypothetical protein